MNIQKIFALCMGLFLAVPFAAADDIDIYNNANEEIITPPLTVLTIDLNVNVDELLCANMLTTNNANCSIIQENFTLRTLLSLLGLDILDLLNGGDGLGGVPDEDDLTDDVPLNPLDLVLAGLLGSIFDALPTPAEVLAPLLDTKIDELPNNILVDAALEVLSTTINSVISDILELTTGKLITSLLNQIVDSITTARLAVLVSHNSAADPGPACDFADNLAGNRRDTLACSNGGYVLLGFIDLLNDPQADIDRLTDKINSLAPGLGGSAAHPYQGKEMYLEMHRYLTGGEIFNGHLGYLDYGDTDETTNLDEENSVLAWDESIENGDNTSYVAALDTFPNACDEVNILNIMLSNSSNDDESDDVLNSTFPGAQSFDGNGDDSELTFGELVGYLDEEGFQHNGETINIKSYFLLNGAATDEGILDNLGQTVQSVPNILNLFGLGDQAADLFNPVLSESASLNAPTTTPSIANPSLLEEDVFISLFAADEEQRPRWSGNLKKLKFADITGSDGDPANDFNLVDLNGLLSADSDGRIDEEAVTFWTDTSQLGGADEDGRTVELGGAGQNIPGFGGNPELLNSLGGRKLYYDAGNIGSLTRDNLNADPATASLLQSSLGAADATEAEELLRYARGFKDGSTTEARPWLMGAVLHSQPLAINYGARGSFDEDNPDIRILVGSTDGFMRMFQNTDTGDNESGIENWGFMPRAVMGQQSILKDNIPGSAFQYGVDGRPVVFINDSSPSGAADRIIDTVNSSSDDQVLAFFGLRRGGSAYYGLDISNPDDPQVLWRIDSDQADFAELGLSFSTPRVGQLFVKPNPAGDAELKTVLAFSGGYSTEKDAEKGSEGTIGTNDIIGNAFFIVDAETGGLIWKATHTNSANASLANYSNRTFSHPLLDDSIPATITTVDTNGSGFIDRGYVGDTGGRVWRADFASDDVRDWTITPIASVGRHDADNIGSATVADDRRFFHRADFVRAKDSTGAFDTVLIGSGDRNDPFNKTTQNFFYSIRDRDVTPGKALADVEVNEANILGHKNDGTANDEIVDLTNSCTQESGGSCPTGQALSKGWRVLLDQSGEKSLSAPFTVAGGVFFTTFVPPDPNSSVCTPLEGASRVFGLGLNNARPLGQTGFKDSGVASRAQTLKSPGYAGKTIYLESGKLLGSDLAEISTNGLEAPDTFWRDKLGDEDQAIAQPDPE